MSLDDKLNAVYRKAKEFNRKRNRAIRRVCIFLLGPGFPERELEKRVQIANELQGRGLNVVVMERLPRWKTTIGDKFKGILGEFRPDLFVVLLTKRGVTHGVTFEIGYLCGHYGSNIAKEKLCFCFEIGTDEKKILTRYIRELFPKIVFHFHSRRLIEVIDEIVYLAEIRAS